MKRELKSVATIVALCALVLPAELCRAQGASTERIFIISSNGLDCLGYTSARATTNFRMILISPSEIDSFYYLYPPAYGVENTPDGVALNFHQNGWATMSATHSITESKGLFTFDNTSKPVFIRGPKWFDQCAFVWVLPKEFEIINYDCNRIGTWKIHDNVISFEVTNANDLVFKLTWKRRPVVVKHDTVLVSTFSSLTNGSNGAAIQITNSSSGIQIDLSDKLLFPSGSASVSDTGRTFLSSIADKIKSLPNYKVTVTGHTDNVPLSKRSSYSSNWQLSAARAVSVSELLMSFGIPDSVIEIRAKGPSEPRASNDTPEGRAQNRRIEVEVVTKDEE